MAGERKFISENVKRVLLKEYLKEQVKRAGFGGVDIQRTPMGTRVTLITERPGLVIGRKGTSIKSLTDTIEFKFGFDKPQIEVVEVENPNLSAQIMAEKLASALERGWHFRRAGHSTVRRIMDNGARGCQVIIAGKLTGQRHRTEKFKEGHIKYCGEPKHQWMEIGYAQAKLKPGIIGVKVQIMHPKAKLPDEVIIKDLAKEEAPPTEEPAQAVPAGEKKSDEQPSEEKKESVGHEQKHEAHEHKKKHKPKAEEQKPVEPADEKAEDKPKEKPVDAGETEKKHEEKPDKKPKDDVSDLIIEKAETEKAEKKEEAKDGAVKNE